MEDGQASLRGSEPIFPVTDVAETVRYYREVLGLREGWTWGDPPDFGGVRWGKVGAMFALASGTDPKPGGQWHSFFVEGIDALFDFHRRNSAEIRSPLELKPWGLREYTVRDLNGHYLRFGQRGTDRSLTAGRRPATDVAIVERLPTPEEHRGLVRAEGWADNDRPEGGKGACRGPVRRRGRGRGRSRLGYGARRRGDVCLPEGHRRPPRVAGTRIVGALLDILRRSDPQGMLVTLFTGQHLARFYERFGFAGPERLHGMSLTLGRRPSPGGGRREDGGGVMVEEELKFVATPEKGEVSALLACPEGASHLLVLGHGASTTMRHATLGAIAAALADAGIATFRYNFPYAEGGKGRDSQEVCTRTVRAAVAAARGKVPSLPLLAGGHSFGGRMTSTAASESPLDGVRGLVFFSFPLHQPGRPETKRAEYLAAVTVPMLFLSGTRDELAAMDLLRPVCEGLGGRATLHAVDTADHGYKVLKRSRGSKEDVFVEMARVVRGWAAGLE